MKSNLQKLKKRLNKLELKIKQNHNCMFACSDVKSKNQLNAIVVLLSRLGYKHCKGDRNHIEEWNEWLSVLNGEPHMGISVLPNSKKFVVLNWKPSQDYIQKHQCIKLI